MFRWEYKLPTESLITSVLELHCIACRCSDEVNPRKQPYKISNQRLRELGLEFTPAAQALHDTVICFQEKGILPIPAPTSSSSPEPEPAT